MSQLSVYSLAGRSVQGYWEDLEDRWRAGLCLSPFPSLSLLLPSFPPFSLSLSPSSSISPPSFQSPSLSPSPLCLPLLFLSLSPPSFPYLSPSLSPSPLPLSVSQSLTGSSLQEPWPTMLYAVPVNLIGFVYIFSLAKETWNLGELPHLQGSIERRI